MQRKPGGHHQPVQHTILPTSQAQKNFENVIKERTYYEIPWLYEIVPFNTFQDKRVLELGCGAGYDAYEFMRNGANYTGIDLTPENPIRVIKHLSYFGYKPNVMEGDAEALLFHEASFDIVFSNGVLHHTPNMQATFNEAFRVLSRDGAFWVILYHKNSIFFWLTLFLFDHILRLGFLKRSFKERLSMIEYTSSGALPLVNVYTKNQVKEHLLKAGFLVENLWVRKLVKEDLPSIPLLRRLYKYIPKSTLDYFGSYFGWYIIAKARKN